MKTKKVLLSALMSAGILLSGSVFAQSLTDYSLMTTCAQQTASGFPIYIKFIPQGMGVMAQSTFTTKTTVTNACGTSQPKTYVGMGSYVSTGAGAPGNFTVNIYQGLTNTIAQQCNVPFPSSTPSASTNVCLPVQVSGSAPTIGGTGGYTFTCGQATWVQGNCS